LATVLVRTAVSPTATVPKSTTDDAVSKPPVGSEILVGRGILVGRENPLGREVNVPAWRAPQPSRVMKTKRTVTNLV